MYMMIDTKGDVHFLTEETDLRRELLNLCFIWTNDERYDSELNYKELYEECWDNEDFGDIAQVFRCDKTELGFDLMEVGETAHFTRIL